MRFLTKEWVYKIDKVKATNGEILNEKRKRIVKERFERIDKEVAKVNKTLAQKIDVSNYRFTEVLEVKLDSNIMVLSIKSGKLILDKPVVIYSDTELNNLKKGHLELKAVELFVSKNREYEVHFLFEKMIGEEKKLFYFTVECLNIIAND